MQSLLKYLLPVIAVIVFWNCSEVSMSASLEVDNIEVATIESTAQSDVYEAETDPSLSLRSTQRMQGASRRPSDLQRYGHKFIKVGKIIIVNSSSVEPTQRLITLGRLII